MNKEKMINKYGENKIQEMIGCTKKMILEKRDFIGETAIKLSMDEVLGLHPFFIHEHLEYIGGESTLVELPVKFTSKESKTQENYQRMVKNTYELLKLKLKMMEPSARFTFSYRWFDEHVTYHLEKASANEFVGHEIDHKAKEEEDLRVNEGVGWLDIEADIVDAMGVSFDEARWLRDEAQKMIALERQC